MQIKKTLFLKIFLLTFLLTSVTFSQAMLTTGNSLDYTSTNLLDKITIQDPTISLSESNEIEISI